MHTRTDWVGATAFLSLALAAPAVGQGQDGPVGFESPRWTLVDAELTEHLGRSCLAGAAILSDADFGDGIIEVDVAVDGRRSYPGIVFRLQSEADYERLYVRPHRAGLYPDAVQYTPVINGTAGWQLYNGTGYTSGAEIPAREWVTLRLEVQGSQARVFLGGDVDPVLEIHRLEHGESRGAIGVLGPKDGSACFSNFRYRQGVELAFQPPPVTDPPPGVINHWEISRSFKAERANRQQYPGFYALFLANWETLAAEPSGLVDVSRLRPRTEGGADLVLARTVLRSEREQHVTLHFGYSDEIDLFLNGRKVFAGNSSYQFRDPSFLGIVGYYDAVTLPLEPGLNEIFAYVTETFGGWGLMGRVDGDVRPPVKDHSRLTRVWSTPNVFLTPESVLYDRERDVLYVTSFDAQYAQSEEPTGYISKLSLDGEIVEQHWVTDLHAPTGMAIRGNALFTLERGTLTEIDTETATVRRRYPIPDVDFPNDLVMDRAGNIYITDTRTASAIDSRVYRFRDGAFEVWLDGDLINRANGVFLHGDELLVGNTGDGMLKAIDLQSKRSRNVVCLGARILDGIKVDGGGNYLVSHWEGQVYQVTPDGDVVEILDLMPEGLNTADFEYVADRRLLLIPTFLGNSVVAFRLEED